MRRSAPSSRALDRAGHDVVAAGSLAEMRRALDRGLPDVLVTDVVLPDGNGLDAVAGFVRDHPRLPVIVLSAQNTLTTAVRARSEEHPSELQSLMPLPYAVFCLNKNN